MLHSITARTLRQNVKHRPLTVSYKLHCRNGWNPVPSRCISTEPSSNTSPSDSKLPLNAPPSRQKVKLHMKPHPIPSTSPSPSQDSKSASKSPSNSAGKGHVSFPKVSPAIVEPPLNLGIKDTVKLDIADAEEQGILKPPSPDASTFQTIVHKTLEVTKFYFRGAREIFRRQSVVRSIRRRVKKGEGKLLRDEFRVLRAQKQDINRIIPFLAIVLLFEEMIPVLVLYAPYMLPSTCLLPGQRKRIADKRTFQAAKARSVHADILVSLDQASQNGIIPTQALHRRHAPYVLSSLLRLPTFGFDLLRIYRIRRHLNFLTVDDHLLNEEDAMKDLDNERLDQALGERGFITTGQSRKEKQAQLEWWLNSVADTPATDAITRRLFLLVQQHA